MADGNKSGEGRRLKKGNAKGFGTAPTNNDALRQPRRPGRKGSEELESNQSQCLATWVVNDIIRQAFALAYKRELDRQCFKLAARTAGLMLSMNLRLQFSKGDNGEATRQNDEYTGADKTSVLYCEWMEEILPKAGNQDCWATGCVPNRSLERCSPSFSIAREHQNTKI